MRARAPDIVLITPYLAAANNGNWRTAARWARLLAPRFSVAVHGPDDALDTLGRTRARVVIALHARRSRPAIALCKDTRPDLVRVVALTGTDLYGDLPAGDAAVAASLADADGLIVLQADALAHLPEHARGKAHVVHQSANRLAPWPHKRDDRVHCVLVAHLRREKDPVTALAAWALLPHELPATLTLVGAALDPGLAAVVTAAAAADPRIRWLGARPHGWTRQAIKRAHLLLCPSLMEGGAHVVIEAVTSGTPVLGSAMSGNIGLLGPDYPGYFPVGDAPALARLVARAQREQGFRVALAAASSARAPLFLPAREQASLVAAVDAAIRAHAATIEA
jgi:putative glycosyltransferase (TIGR04348 family)